MLPRLSSLLANSILVNELYVLGIVLPCPPIRVKRAACTRILCACLGSSGKVLSGDILQYHASILDHRLVCLNGVASGIFCDRGIGLYMIGNRMASLMGGKQLYRPKASAPLSARLIFSIVHSVNCCKLRVAVDRSLETDSARARSNPDRMASYSASLLDAENPSRMACSRCSPVGDCNKSPTPEPDEREAPSTRRVHHSCSLIRGAAFAQLNLVCRMLRRGWSVSTITGWLENRGGAFEQHFEELRLLAPFLNTWFLHLPMPADIVDRFLLLWRRAAE
ncbi:hypothetical protein CK203_003319 [Vitis vinifera]|uniref:Uncharacterized protein n=1 Tax=Vitis vinifera TaxID=29760 RepID=A0A438K6N5_VITVI|nr:hypothetical protein CK203_003319 [Vitis vinifera]